MMTKVEVEVVKLSFVANCNARVRTLGQQTGRYRSEKTAKSRKVVKEEQSRITQHFVFFLLTCGWDCGRYHIRYLITILTKRDLAFTCSSIDSDWSRLSFVKKVALRHLFSKSPACEQQIFVVLHGMKTAFFASPFRLIIYLVTYCVVARAMPRLVNPVPRVRLTDAALLICDVQVKFESLIYRSGSVIDNIALLNEVANTLDIPVIVTEQYPKVFGPTSKVRYLL